MTLGNVITRASGQRIPAFADTYLFGAVGIIIGPVIAALFTSVWFIFRETYSGLLEAEEEADAGDTPAEDG